MYQIASLGSKMVQMAFRVSSGFQIATLVFKMIPNRFQLAPLSSKKVSNVFPEFKDGSKWLTWVPVWFQMAILGSKFLLDNVYCWASVNYTLMV